MQSVVSRFRKNYPVVFGGLVAIVTVLLAMVTIFWVNLTYIRGSWAILNGIYYLIITSPLIISLAAGSTLCALNCKARYAIALTLSGLFIYGLSFYVFVVSHYLDLPRLP